MWNPCQQGSYAKPACDRSPPSTAPNPSPAHLLVVLWPGFSRMLLPVLLCYVLYLQWALSASSKVPSSVLVWSLTRLSAHSTGLCAQWEDRLPSAAVKILDIRWTWLCRAVGPATQRITRSRPFWTTEFKASMSNLMRFCLIIRTNRGLGI